MFVTYAYGGARYVKLALLCALSIKARRPDAEIVIYTDRPAFFTAQGFSARLLSRVELAGMRGPMEYRHRVKIGVLLRHALEVPAGTPVVYVDSDTYFRGGETELKGRPFVMHHFDGFVGTDYYPRLNRFFIDHAAGIAAGPYAGMATGFTMYNSGLIGFEATLESVRLLHAAQAFTDWLCVRFPEQNEWAEQIAFSWIGKTGPGVAVDPMGFAHYWTHNTEVAELLKNESPDALRALAADEARFDALIAEATRLQGNRLHRWTVLRRKRWNRSIDKRRAQWRARRLRDVEG